jgi:hypothetical protein
VIRRVRPATVLLAAALAAALLAAACSGSPPSVLGASKDRSSATTSSSLPPGVGGTCSGYAPGVQGVVQTYCHGKAAIALDIDGAPSRMTGGSCTVTRGYYMLNAGVVVGPAFSGRKPDFVGMALPADDGNFTNGTISLVSGGHATPVARNTGWVAPDGKSGRFSGTAANGTAVKGSWSC